MGTRRHDPSASAAFTLLEMSVVLALIGLLTGGILMGRTMIRQSEVGSAWADARRYIAAINAFQQKYDALPGDMANATEYWGRADGGTDLTQNCGNPEWDNAVPTATCNGDGDGRITLASTVAAINTEIFRSWQHLSLAGLVEGGYTGVPTAHNTANPGYPFDYASPGVDVPASKVPGAGFTIYYSAIGNFCGVGGQYTTGPDVKVGHHILGFGKEGILPDGGILTTLEAEALDQKFDDGKPGTGVVRAYCEGYCSTTADTGSSQYNTALGGTQCAMLFFTQF